MKSFLSTKDSEIIYKVASEGRKKVSWSQSPHEPLCIDETEILRFSDWMMKRKSHLIQPDLTFLHVVLEVEPILKD
jgi:hypothetical protein